MNYDRGTGFETAVERTSNAERTNLTVTPPPKPPRSYGRSISPSPQTASSKHHDHTLTNGGVRPPPPPPPPPPIPPSHLGSTKSPRSNVTIDDSSCYTNISIQESTTSHNHELITISESEVSLSESNVLAASELETTSGKSTTTFKKLKSKFLSSNNSSVDNESKKDNPVIEQSSSRNRAHTELHSNSNSLKQKTNNIFGRSRTPPPPSSTSMVQSEGHSSLASLPNEHHNAVKSKSSSILQLQQQLQGKLQIQTPDHSSTQYNRSNSPSPRK